MVTVKVNVAPDAPNSVTSQVSVSGGGSATANGNDVTTIQTVIVLSLTNQGSTSMSYQGFNLIGVSGTQTNTCPITLDVNVPARLASILRPGSRKSSPNRIGRSSASMRLQIRL